MYTSYRIHQVFWAWGACDSAKKYTMASTGFSFGHSGSPYPFDFKPLPSCAKGFCNGHSCVATECNPEQQCAQSCIHCKCDMECNEQNCHQRCNTGSSKCILKCHGSNQRCKQKCNHGECEMACNGRNCHQHCNSGSSNCSLKCHDNNQRCIQKCNHGKCDMECNGRNCHQRCNTGSSKCSLECHASNQTCTQECNHGECEMECHGQNCHQHCNTGSSKCRLECHNSNQRCTQECNHGECEMECNGQNCHQHCNTCCSTCSLECHDSNQNLFADGSNQYQRTCFADHNSHNNYISTATTTKKITLARWLTRASVHYHPCRHYCTGELSNSNSFFHVTSSFSKITNQQSYWRFIVIRYDLVKTWRLMTFKLDRFFHFLIEDIWISKFMPCVTLNGDPRRISRRSKEQ